MNNFLGIQKKALFQQKAAEPCGEIMSWTGAWLEGHEDAVIPRLLCHAVIPLWSWMFQYKGFSLVKSLRLEGFWYHQGHCNYNNTLFHTLKWCRHKWTCLANEIKHPQSIKRCLWMHKSDVFDCKRMCNATAFWSCLHLMLPHLLIIILSERGGCEL